MQNFTYESITRPLKKNRMQALLEEPNKAETNPSMDISIAIALLQKGVCVSPTSAAHSCMHSWCIEDAAGSHIPPFVLLRQVQVSGIHVIQHNVVSAPHPPRASINALSPRQPTLVASGDSSQSRMIRLGRIRKSSGGLNMMPNQFRSSTRPRTGAWGTARMLTPNKVCDILNASPAIIRMLWGGRLTSIVSPSGVTMDIALPELCVVTLLRYTE